MRVRLVVLLIALMAIVAVPSEATVSQQSGSVVDQVTSCREANGLARETDARTSPDGTCQRDLPGPLSAVLLAMVVGLLAGSSPRSGSGVLAAADERWRRPEAVARAGAPWRAPPLPV